MKTKLVALAAAAVAIIPLTGSPATAGAGAGKIAFSCVASLPEFPSPASNGTCGTGTLGTGPAVPSSAVGTLHGVTDNNTPFTFTAGGAGAFNANFSYREPCVAGEPPATGEAEGTATITGTVVINGTTASASVTVNFVWTRVGATAAIQITGGSTTIPGVTGNVAGVAQASFAPVLTAANLCPVGGSLKAAVAGSAAVAVTP